MKKLLLLLIIPLLFLNSCKPDFCYCAKEWFTMDDESFEKCAKAYGNESGFTSEEWDEKIKNCR